MKTVAILALGVLVGGGAVWAWTSAPFVKAADEVRPPRDPVVAVGSRITWNIPNVENGHEQQRLDVYAPADVHDAPVVVYAHRGEWARGDKAEVSHKPKFLNERGVVFVSVNYRLSDVARHPAQVDDVAAAVKWVHDHIADHGGSPDRIVLMGHSAGCHIVSMVGLDPRPLQRVGLTPAVLRAVVCWSGGAYDLPEKVAGGGMYKPYIEKNFGTEREQLDDASPIQHVDEVLPGQRFLFVSAGAGNPGSRVLSEKMARGIQAAGGIGKAITLEGKTHFTADYECGSPNDPLNSGTTLMEFIEASTAPEALH